MRYLPKRIKNQRAKKFSQNGSKYEQVHRINSVICFTFNTKVTNALLFWRESHGDAQRTNRSNAIRHSPASCLFLAHAKCRFTWCRSLRNVCDGLVRTKEFCAGKCLQQQLSLFIYCVEWVVGERNVCVHWIDTDSSRITYSAAFTMRCYWISAGWKKKAGTCVFYFVVFLPAFGWGNDKIIWKIQHI